MDPADFAAFVALLQEEHDLDDASATELARALTGALVQTFEKAGSVLSTKGLDPKEAPRVLTSDHLRFALAPFVLTSGPSKMMPSFIRADGDGNCLLTTLALDMEMKVRHIRISALPFPSAPVSPVHSRISDPSDPLQRGVALARACLEEGRAPTEEEGVPYLDGTSGECAWLDGLELRRSFARFYGADRIHRELPESFGNVSWQEKVPQEDGSHVMVTRERRMTRCDMICSEVQSMRHGLEVDFSESADALASRVALAAKYVQDISRHGVWCSTPSIVAFSIARIEKRSVRVYYFSGSSLYVYADTVPEGALPPPPTRLDEFMLDFQAAKDARTSGAVEADDDDIHDFLPSNVVLEDEEDDDVPLAAGCSSPVDATADEHIADVEPDVNSYTQDITRILFNGGHYDLAVTSAERMALVRVFPDLERNFQRFPESLQPSFLGKK